MKNLAPLDLQSRLASAAPPMLVDVREFPEFASGRLLNARLLPLAELEQRAQELPRDRPLVTVCRTGRRSAEAAAKLERLGFTDVAQLAGGVSAWQEQGLPLERDARAPWALERQVRLVAGSLVLLGLSLSLLWPPAIALSWFVSLGLIFAALTDSCAMGMLLAKMPWNRRSESATCPAA